MRIDEAEATSLQAGAVDQRHQFVSREWFSARQGLKLDDTSRPLLQITKRDLGQHIGMQYTSFGADKAEKRRQRLTQMIDPDRGIDQDQAHGRSRGAASKSG